MSKPCEQCGAIFHKRPKASAATFERRLYCSVGCSVEAHFWKEHGFTLARVKRALRYDPDLEIWQIVERFAVCESTAEEWRRRYGRRVDGGPSAVRMSA